MSVYGYHRAAARVIAIFCRSEKGVVSEETNQCEYYHGLYLGRLDQGQLSKTKAQMMDVGFWECKQHTKGSRMLWHIQNSGDNWTAK